MNEQSKGKMCACGTHTAAACEFAGSCEKTVYPDPNRTDPVVEANRELLLKRSQFGIKKYGVTLEEAQHSEIEILTHALEEALDLSNYLQARIMAVRARLGKD